MDRASLDFYIQCSVAHLQLHSEDFVHKICREKKTEIKEHESID